MFKSEILDMKLSEVFNKYTFAKNFFEENNLNVDGQEDKSIREFLDCLDEDYKVDMAIDSETVLSSFESYIEMMREFLGIEDNSVDSLTLIAGRDKFGNPEGFDKFTIHKSEIISIVGPTGSGKSRLLADIEWTAQNDTPTGRSILINGKVPDKKWRFSSNNKLVAQLSQNMNFVMDLTAMEFVKLHAESRMIENIDEVAREIIDEANKLAGEKFSEQTPITSLSGGQSRALMIADTAKLSSSPIVLIDEIENAGIDRKKALDLLVNQDKIVLMATHDPYLALIADKRIVINNGAIANIIETSEEERKMLKELEKIDQLVQSMRTSLRYGERMSSSMITDRLII